MKPPYRVPTMEEVARMRGSNGLRAVSTFSGCGGSCLGLEMAGFEVMWASEFVEAAREVYRLNHPGVHVDERDIREVTAQDILSATGLKPGELDLFEGSPPCASFSMAGKRDKLWGEVKKYSDVKQRTDDLFLEYVRLLDGLRPRAFVAENVPGMVRGKAIGYFKAVMRMMMGLGYRVEARVLDAQWLGVPQARQRLIFVGVREDLGVEPPFPKPLPYRYSVNDAIGDLAHIHKMWVQAYVKGQRGWDRVRLRNPNTTPSPTILAQDGSTRSPLYVNPVIQECDREAIIEGYAVGDEWHRLRPGEASDKYHQLYRSDHEKPSRTITSTLSTGIAGPTHGYEPRRFTIAELRRICSFPDDFQLTGTFKQQWERLGRAVPPLMMRAVAEKLTEVLL